VLKRLLIALLVSAVSAPAASILSENFNELTAQLGVTSAGAFTAVDGTNVDIAGNSNGWGFLCGGPDSGNCLDLDGSGGNPQGILASGLILLNPGNDYYLSYDLIGSNRGLTTSTTVTFGSYSQTFTLGSSDTTSGVVNNALITVSVPTETQLIFTSNTPGQVGSVLDNVSITSADVSSGSSQSSATPEAPTFILLTLVVGMALLFRAWARPRPKTAFRTASVL
jgi:hypothetical protein